MMVVIDRIKCIVTLFLLFFWVGGTASYSKTIGYKKNKLYSLDLSPYYVTSIHFPDSLEVKRVYCGDPSSWEILHSNSKDNSIFIKPKRLGVESDLIVLAGNKDVFFKIKSAAALQRDPLLSVSLVFPSSQSNTKKRAVHSIHPYCFKGDESLRPRWMYDNGVYTYLSWPNNRSLPAIYRYNCNSKQRYVTNFRVNGRDFLLPKVSRSWLLKRGESQAVLTRARHDGNRSYCNG